MPGMPRTSRKSREIAYSILGVPSNMKKQPGPKKKIIKILKIKDLNTSRS